MRIFAYISLSLLAAMLENAYICLYYFIFACCYAGKCVYLRILLYLCLLLCSKVRIFPYISLCLLAAMLGNRYICVYKNAILLILPLFACCYAAKCVYLRMSKLSYDKLS